MDGPRVFSTGENTMPISPRTGPSNYEQAEDFVRQLADIGGISLKIYLDPRRDQRQMYSEAARKYGLSVTNEGADLFSNIASMLDGNTGFEHPLLYPYLYDDAIQFFGRTKAVYSPTVTVASMSELLSEDYYRSRMKVWEGPRLRRFMPWQQHMRYIDYSTHPKHEYAFPLIGFAVHDLIEAGGYAALGGHGQNQGLDTHIEIWAYAEGLEPIEALELASLGGAYMCGLEDDLGSIEPGKLADLLVLESNPLDDIRNTLDIAYVMKGGVLYDSATLEQIWPEREPVGDPPGMAADDAVYRSDTRSLHYWD